MISFKPLRVNLEVRGKAPRRYCFQALFVASHERVAPAFSKSTRDVGSNRACPNIARRPAHKDKIGVSG
jgi:hypothetical protein